MTAIHHLLVMRSECRRGRSRRPPRSCAGARSRASTVNRGQTVCCTVLRRTGSMRRIRIWCCMYATRNTTRIGRTLATPAGSRRSRQHRGLAPHRVRSRPGPGPSGPERRVDRPASGGTDVVRHRTWRTRALLAIGRITLSASPQRGLGVPLYDNSGVRTHGIDRRYVAEDHLRVLCIPFVAGRAFGEADHRAAGRARGPWSTRHSPSGSAGVGGRWSAHAWR